jgi:hypothetical protein
MQFKISSFEVKKFGENKWREIPEKIFLEKLADFFDLVTPAISEMLQGNEIVTPHEIYRIRS